MDHSVSTTDRTLPILDNDAKLQFEALEKNCRESGVRLFDMNSKNQGIVHIIGPELGITQPGQTLVCGDSHTSTHGAFGTLAFGIGTSEVEHVLATQCLVQWRSTPSRSLPRSPGAPIPAWSPASPLASPIRTTSRISTIKRPPRVRSNTWASRLARPS